MLAGVHKTHCHSLKIRGQPIGTDEMKCRHIDIPRDFLNRANVPPGTKLHAPLVTFWF